MAALGRQQADWLVGLNGTRLFTVLYGGKTLKVGRVQTPTLAMLACHGEEFFKDIQNLLPVEKAKAIRTVSFLPHHDQNICVDHKCSPRNYIIAASTHIEKNEKRDALDKSRKALESLVKNKVWQYVNKYGDGNLSLKLRSATAPIELRNLTEQLKSKILKEDFSDSEKNAVLLPLEMLL